MKKLLVSIFTLLLMACSCLLLVACNDNGGGDDARIIEVYNSYVVYAQENGVEPLSYEQWLATIKGEKGDKGDKGDQGQAGIDGIDGKDGKDGKDGADGKDGQDGLTPTIGISEDGYWVINGIKTTYKAIGTDGKDGVDGVDGKEIKTAIIDANGDLIITYTDNTTVNAGNVVVKNPTLDENNKITFKNIELDGTNGFIKVANGTTTFSFLDEIELKGNVAYTVSSDMLGLNVIPTKTVELIDGDNVFYVLETCGNEAKLYTITIRRDLHTVKFNTNGGSNVDTMIVKTGDTISAPVSKKDGYGLLSWDYDFNSPITEDIIINANWTAIFSRSGNKINDLTEYGKTLSEITIPASIDGVEITSIGSGAFMKCESLRTIEIPSGVTSIADFAFSECNNLQTVTFGANSQLQSIGYVAFSSCSSLRSIEIPASVTGISNGAFLRCEKLNTVTFGKNSQLTSIGKEAFYDCDNLSIVYYGGDFGEWVKISIGDYNSCLTNATRYYYIENESDLPSDDGNYWHYVDGVPTIWESKRDN